MRSSFAWSRARSNLQASSKRSWRSFIGWEVPSVGGVFAAEPGGADAEREASVGDVVDRAGDFGDEPRVAEGVAEHQMTDPEAVGAGGDGRGER